MRKKKVTKRIYLANKAIELSADIPALSVISTVPKVMLDILGDDPSSTKKIAVDFHPELKIRWEKWLREGFPDDDKKAILEKYPRKGELYVEAPKINIEIVSVMTDIAKKRDGHFADTQNSVGSALSALHYKNKCVIFTHFKCVIHCRHFLHTLSCVN